MENDGVLLIPAYNPVDSLPAEVKRVLAENAFASVVVVNDGSASDKDVIFAELEGMPGVAVVHHARNMGKGAAIKTGLRLIAERWSHCGVVTADADGQHAVEDIVRVADALRDNPSKLVLGVRSFCGTVPLRSRFGNLLTRKLVRIMTGQSVTDTQTGLRGIPAFFIPELLKIEANGYEFEMDMLMSSRGVCGVLEVPIRTIYIDGNATSHFNPILDSMRIYMVLLRYVVASILSAVVDNLLFVALFMIWPNIVGCQVAGRLGSLCLNYSLNRSKVFRSSEEISSSMPRYLALVVFSGVMSYFFIRMLHSAGMGVITAKLVAETLLFFFNFVVQRTFIFKIR